MRFTLAAACRSLVGCLFALALTVPALAAQPKAATVLDLAAQQKNLTTFVAAVHMAGLDDMLKAAGPLTVYAPTDDAFAKMSAADRDALMHNPDRLKDLILGCVLKDEVVMHSGDSSVSTGYMPSAAGRNLTFALDGDRQTVGGAHLVATDMRAGNGYLDTIDKVLLP
ncbi:MAG: fasciclin domain-containing protein [Candidatus Eremiobacteraeota bacterium]|nr:fasciclin domain-containing protein [Candidatus Eremiobacteraeota bacterium]